LGEQSYAGKNRNSLYFLTMMTGAVSAAPVLNYTGAERLEEARQREEERQERLRMPRVENMGSSLNEKEEMQGAALEPVFRIDEIILSGQEEKFGWLQGIIQPHIHTDMGISSVNRLVKDLNAKLLDKGYVTSRVVIPEQNMKNGKLLLRIQTGRLHKIIYSRDSAVIPWKNAFPLKEGDILNIRRLEQGLEQMKRVSSSDVSMKLLPADNI
jgi:hemolysin activation/secretion protein